MRASDAEDGEEGDTKKAAAKAGEGLGRHQLVYRLNDFRNADDEVVDVRDLIESCERLQQPNLEHGNIELLRISHCSRLRSLRGMAGLPRLMQLKLVSSASGISNPPPLPRWRPFSASALESLWAVLPSALP